MDLSKDNPTSHNSIPAELPGVDLEADSNNAQVVSPTVVQSNAERVQAAIQNSVLIDRNPVGFTGVATLVDEQPAVLPNPTALSQECANPKVEPTQVEVQDEVEEGEADDDVAPPALIDRDEPDNESDSDDQNDDDITSTAEGSYVNSDGLRLSNRERTRLQVLARNTPKAQ